MLMLAGVALTTTAAAQLPKFDELLKGLGRAQPKAGTDPATGAAGIKEALAQGTERAVADLSRENGYFGDAAVKILLPTGLRKLADVARLAGYQDRVDAFVLSMNRAAEAAAPAASRHFGDAIRDMTLQDVQGILTGGDTAATEYFRRRTHEPLYAAFKPIVSRKVGEVGATQAYKALIARYERLPLMSAPALDLDDHVTNKALDGLFHVVGEQERRIRTDPAARTTALLRQVFGG
jgi:hypothetical protein